MREPLIIGEDGLARCWWGRSTPDYAPYHDREWGRPVTDAPTTRAVYSAHGPAPVGFFCAIQ